MKGLFDTLRLLVISPESLVAVLPAAVHSIWPTWLEALEKSMRDSLAMGLSAAGICVAALAFIYKEGDSILDPKAGRGMLLDWPDYPMLKRRVVAALTWGVIGIGAALVATWMVASGARPQVAPSVLVAGVLVSAAAAATVALARY